MAVMKYPAFNLVAIIKIDPRASDHCTTSSSSSISGTTTTSTQVPAIVPNWSDHGFDLLSFVGGTI